MNNPTTLVIENGATIVTRMPPDYSRIVNSGGVINVVSSVPYPPLPQILNEIRNFSFPNSTSIPSITPHDPVPPASIDSAADISKSPPQVVVIGENCNAGEIEVEIQNRLASMGVSPVQVHSNCMFCKEQHYYFSGNENIKWSIDCVR